MSESQERMMAVVEPDDVERVPGDLRQVGRRGRRGRRGHRHRPAAHRLARRAGRRRAAAVRRARRADVPAPLRAPGLAGRPAGRRRRGAAAARRPATSCATPCCGWSPRPNLCDKSWITDQYDRYVRGNTVLAQPSRQRHGPRRRGDQPRGRGRRPTATAGSPSSTRTPARSSRWPSPTATSPPAAPRRWRSRDCLNFGSPEDPAVMWQFAEACRGLKDACLELGIPVTGGNVSLYNQTGETAILPTPVVAVLGVIDDVTRRTPVGVRAPPASGSSCSARPARSCPARSGRTSCTATSAACRRGSTWPPRRRSAELLRRRRRAASPAPTTSPTAGWRRRWSSPRLRHDVGVTVSLPGDAFVALFAESAGRVLVTVAAGDEACPDRPRRAPRRTRSPRSARPAATRSSSTASSTSRWPSSAPPGPPPSRPPSPDRVVCPTTRLARSAADSTAAGAAGSRRVGDPRGARGLRG